MPCCVPDSVLGACEYSEDKNRLIGHYSPATWLKEAMIDSIALMGIKIALMVNSYLELTKSGIVFNFLFVLTHLVLTITLGVGLFSSYFKGEETEAQRGEVIHPMSKGQQMVRQKSSPDSGTAVFTIHHALHKPHTSRVRMLLTWAVGWAEAVGMEEEVAMIIFVSYNYWALTIQQELC